MKQYLLNALNSQRQPGSPTRANGSPARVLSFLATNFSIATSSLLGAPVAGLQTRVRGAYFPPALGGTHATTQR